MSDQRHWDAVYDRLGPAPGSWYEPMPEASLALVEAAAVTTGRSAIDVGGGTSLLVDELLRRGFVDLTVLDVSEVALERARRRLGPRGQAVCWIAADVRDWAPERTYDLWHDRATFHFLVDEEDREGYLRAATAALEPGAHLVVGTFSREAPSHCSGLPVERYSPEALARALGPAFSLREARKEAHVTPRGTVQPFSWALFRRT